VSTLQRAELFLISRIAKAKAVSNSYSNVNKTLGSFDPVALVDEQIEDSGGVPRLLEPVAEPQSQTTLRLTDRVFVKDGRRGWFVPVADIVVFESEGNYSRVSFEQHRPLVPRSLNYLEERLDPTMFFRASRKHIVNLRRVKTIEVLRNSTLLLHMSDGSAVPMSRRRSRLFKHLTAI
jgi:two-component system LytT family response regulator